MTAIAWKQQVAQAFDLAAGDYDQHAGLQRRVANDLFQLIKSGVEVSCVSCGLEIGCGTGFLTLPTVQHFSRADWTVTDVAPRMLERCQQQLVNAGRDMKRVSFIRQDGEDIEAADNTYELVCSNLTFQWFTDWRSSLQRLMNCVRPGGYLAFTTLASGTFTEVNRYLGPPDLGAGFESYMNQEELGEWLAQFDKWSSTLRIEEMTERFTGPGAFLRALKGIGACTSLQTAPRKISEMRSTLHNPADGQQLFEADYRVLFAFLRREVAS